MFCGKCGKEVPDGYEFCMNCGTRLEQLTEQAVETEKKKKKWIIPVLAVVVVVSVVIGAIALISVNQKKNGLYNNIAWGTSFDDIKEMVEKHSKDEVTVNENKTVVYDNVENYQDFEGINAIVCYKCNDEKELESVYLIVSNNEESKYTDEMIYDGLSDKFTKLYGEYEDKSFEKIWTTPNSVVTLTYMTEGMLIVDYEDISSN